MLQYDEDYQITTEKPQNILQTSGKNALKSYHGNSHFNEPIKRDSYLHLNQIVQTNNKTRTVNQLNSITEQEVEKLKHRNKEGGNPTIRC